jgi:hypothetical protein
MNRDEAKEQITKVVEMVQGCKATELVAHPEIVPIIVEFDSGEYFDMIEELVSEGNLVEIEYVLPNMNFKVKSFLLPKGTTVDIVSRNVPNLASMEAEKINLLGTKNE